MIKKIKGSCLCGSVAYEFLNEYKVFQYCHCSRCRKFTGSAHASNIVVDPDKFHWTRGEEFVGRFELPEARHFATCFCRNCGSSLPWLTKSHKAIVIPAGTLDDDPEIRPIQNIYFVDRAPWYEDPDDLIKYDELPVR